MSKIVVDLPFPPSQNHLWRGSGKHVYRSAKYMNWIKEVGWLIKLGKFKKIEGKFHATIILCPPDNRNRDLDNFSKGLLDAAQKNGLIENDHFCRLLIVSYGDKTAAPLGSRLIIESA